MRFCWLCGGAGLLSLSSLMVTAWSQTPPISPKTQDTPVPAAVALPPPPVATADVPNRPLTADEAARIALRRQPNIFIARSSIEAARGRTQQVRSALLPNVSVSAGYTNVQTISSESSGNAPGVTAGTGNGNGSGGTGTGTGGTGGTGTGGTGTGAGTGGTGTGTGTGTGGTGTGSTGTGTGTGGTGTVFTTGGGSGTVTTTGAIPGYQASILLRQLLFDFNHTRDLVRQASLQERAAEAELTRVQADTVFQVKQAFYLYAEDSSLVTVNEENLTNRQAQLALTQARLNSGLGLPADVATAQTAVATAVGALVLARNNASLARVNLALLMGVDPRTPILIANQSEPGAAPDDVTPLVDTALRQRPEIVQAQATLKAAQYGVNAAKTTNAPVISANVGLSARGASLLPRNDALTIGAALQFDPFDGGLTQGRVREARANVEIAQAQLQSAQLTVTSDVSQSYLNLVSALQRAAAADSEIINAQEGLRIASGRYRSGLGQFLDIINAQAFLVTARTDRVTAQSTLDQARAALNRAIGAPIPPVR